jgi:hypothetical protein
MQVDSHQTSAAKVEVDPVDLRAVGRRRDRQNMLSPHRCGQSLHGMPHFVRMVRIQAAALGQNTVPLYISSSARRC